MISEPWRKWFQDLLKSGAGEGHITILPWHYSGITQGTWTLLTAAVVMYGYLVNSTAIQNDQVNYKVFLTAGTYTFSVMHEKSSTRGILTLLIDEISVGTIDFYAAGQTFQNQSAITGISVTTAGVKTLSIKAATKNISSSAYGLVIQSMALFRTL